MFSFGADGSDTEAENNLFNLVEEDDYGEALVVVASSDADVDQVDEQGNTALHKAVDKGSPEMVLDLVREGNADITIQNYQGRTPVHIAALTGNLSLLKCLLERPGKSCHQVLLCKTRGEIPLCISLL